MYAFKENTQKKNTMPYNTNLRYNHTAKRQTGPMSDDVRIQYKSDLSYQNQTLGNAQANSGGNTMQSTPIQRYKVSIATAPDSSGLPKITLPKNDTLYDQLQKPNKLLPYFDDVFAKALDKAQYTPKHAWESFNVTMDGYDNTSFIITIEQKDLNNLTTKLAGPVWVVVPDYATGDQFTLAALLLQENNHNILIQQYKYEKAADCPMLELFKQTLDGTSNEDNGCTVIKEKAETRKPAVVRVVYQPQGQFYPNVIRMRPPSYATEFIGNNFTETNRDNLKNRWFSVKPPRENKPTPKEGQKDTETPKSTREIFEESFYKQPKPKKEPNNTDAKEQALEQQMESDVVKATPEEMQNNTDAEKQALEEWMKSTNLPNDLGDKNIFVVWLRHSGANSGAHLEHDTSTTAMRLLITKLVSNTKNIVILAGDKKNEAARQVSTLTNLKKNQIYDYTEFWTWSGDKNPQDWGGDTRLGQLKFYDHLSKKAENHLLHIGSRSGNLELMALIGHKVRYFEEQGSYGGDRMNPFNESTVLDYKKVVAPYPLTFKGELVRVTNHILHTNENLRNDFLGLFAPKNIKDAIMKIGPHVYDAITKETWDMPAPASDDFKNKIKNFYNTLKNKIQHALTNSAEYNGILKKMQSENKFSIDLMYLNILNPMIRAISEQVKPPKNEDPIRKKRNNLAQGFVEQLIVELEKPEDNGS